MYILYILLGGESIGLYSMYVPNTLMHPSLLGPTGLPWWCIILRMVHIGWWEHLRHMHP